MNTRSVLFLGLTFAVNTLFACSSDSQPGGAQVNATGGATSASPASGGANSTGPTGTADLPPSQGGGSPTTNEFAAAGGVGTTTDTLGTSSDPTTLGGAPNAGGATSAGGTDTFTLEWEDDFTTLSTANWGLQTFTWTGNLATFTRQNATVADGILTMSLTPDPDDAERYLGVEARSRKTITYGKISTRMRFAKGSGVVSGLVLFYTPYPNCDWNEIDIEHLGKAPTKSQFNAMVYKGTYNPDCTTSVKPTEDPQSLELGFDAEADFHLYDIEWTPTAVRYYADGVLLRTWTKNISLLKQPMNILLTIWASSASSWAGPVDATAIPSSAQVDWIKVYSWNG